MSTKRKAAIIAAVLGCAAAIFWISVTRAAYVMKATPVLLILAIWLYFYLRTARD